MGTAAGSEVALGPGEELRGGLDELWWDVDWLGGDWGTGDLGLSLDAGFSVGAGVGSLDGPAVERSEGGGSSFFDTRLDKWSICKDWVLVGGFRATSPDR